MGIDRVSAGHGTDARPRLTAEAQAERARAADLIGWLLDTAIRGQRLSRDEALQLAWETIAWWMAQLSAAVRSGETPAQLGDRVRERAAAIQLGKA